MNIKRLMWRVFHPAVICELAADIEDGVVTLKPKKRNLYEGEWRGLDVVINSDMIEYKSRNYIYYPGVTVDNVLYPTPEAWFLDDFLSKIEEDEKAKQTALNFKQMEEKVILPLKAQIRSRSSDLFGLEKRVIREIRHIKKEIEIAKFDLRSLKRREGKMLDFNRRLELINSRITSLRSSEETLADQLREVRELHQQVTAQNMTTTLPLHEEIAGSCHRTRADSVADAIGKELSAIRKSHEDVQQVVQSIP